MNRKYQALFENSITAVFITRPDGTIREANQAACRMFGYSEEELKKMGRQGIIDVNSPGLPEKLKEREQTGSVSGELIGVRKNGKRFLCEFSSTVFDDQDGERMASVMLIDISDKINVQERRKEQTSLYNIAKLNEIELPVNELLNESVKILKTGFVNPKFTGVRITYMEKDYSSDNFDESEKIITAESTSPDGYTLKIEIIIQDDEKTKNQNFIEEEIKLTDAVAELLSLKLYQKETHRDLQLSNERFRYINQVTQEVIYDHDFEKDEITLSENFEKVFGYSFADEEFTLDLWEKNLHPDDRDEINRRLENTLNDKNANKWKAEFRYARKDGTYAHVFENSYLIRDKSGTVVRMIGSIKDVTDRKYREIKQEIISNISQTFNEAFDVRSSLNRSLPEFRRIDDFKMAEIWLVDSDAKLLNMVASLEDNAKEFYQAEEQITTFEYGAGLPGKTLETGETQTWENLGENQFFVRRNAAKEANLEIGLGFPIFDVNEVMQGVLLLALDEGQAGYISYIPLLEELAEHLGEEIQRKKTEVELNRIFESSPDIICIAGIDGYFKKVNPAMSDLLGYTEEELLITPIMEFIHPEDREDTAKQFDLVNRDRENHYYENRYITKSGKIVWLSWTSKLFLDEEIAYTVARDITDQKELEELLDQANRLARIGSWEFDLKKNELFWTDMTREIHEVKPGFTPTPENAIGYYKEGDSRERIQEAVEEAKKEGTPWDLELKIVTAKGNERWVRTIGEAEHMDGECVRLYGSFQDIHEKKGLEELVERTTRMAKVGSWELDLRKDNSEMYWTDMTREILEVDEDYIPTVTSRFEFYTPKSKERIQKAVDNAINNGEPFDLELLATTAKGKEKWIRCIGQSEVVDGKCVRIYGSFQDIDDRKSVEERLKNTTNNLPGIIFQYWLDPDGNDSVKYLSEGSSEIWGVPAEVAMEDFDRIWVNAHKEDIEGIRESIVKSANSLNRWHHEWRYHHPDGSLRWQEGYGTPKKIADGTVVWDSIIFDITETKELELLLERTSKLARVGSWDLNLRESENKMYWSEMTREILEVDESDEATLEGMLAFYKLESKIRAQKAVEKALKSGDSFDLELLLTTAKGRDRWIRSIGQIEFEDGKPVRMFGSYQDIHQRKVAELAYKETLEEKNRTLESISDAFYAIDENWTITYFNKEAERILGKRAAQVIGNNIWEEFAPARQTELYSVYKEVMDHKKPKSLEIYYQPLDRWFEVSVYPADSGVSVYFKDITKRKENEEKIKQINERFEKVTKATNDAIWDFDVLNGNLYWGKGFDTLFGYDLEKINPSLGFLASLIHPDDRERVTQKINQYMSDTSKTDWFEEYKFQREDGSYAYVMDRAVFIRNKSGEVTRVVGAMTDLTRQKEYEESLKQLNIELEQHAKELAISNAELEQFAFVASHDLQEPLRMVTSFLAQLERKYYDVLDEAGKKYIYFATDGANRMRQMILDLLEYSRVGRADAAHELVDINEVLHSVTILQQKVIEEKEADVEWEPMPMIKASGGAIQQLFQNLIQNALNYQKKGNKPLVKIWWDETETHWTFFVKDNGIGIHPDYQEKIFNIFQRLHGRDEYSGTGVGLAICKKIVENHGGKIGVDSAEGEGSTFYFTINKNVV